MKWELKHNIILIGFMGCGKSTIGKRVASNLGYEFMDTDLIIEKQQGRSISDIFETEGEMFFRTLETKTIEGIRETSDKKVISVGGGLPLKEENQRILKDLGLVIYLKAEPDTIYERVKNDKNRPLLQTKNPKETIVNMLHNREDKYRMAARQIVQVDGKKIEDVAEEIENIVKETKEG